MGLSDTWWLIVCGTALLVIVAGAGYWYGRRPRASVRQAPQDSETQPAVSLVIELSGVANRQRQTLSAQARAVRKFAARLSRFERRQVLLVHEICDAAEEMLKSTMRFMAELSRGYDELVQQMAHLASFAELRVDPLTGAANRRGLDEALNRLLAEQARHAVGISLAMIDVDFFKQLNETRSHMRGDRVLADLVEVLGQWTRQCDLVARFGGEEFVVVMPHTDLHGASLMAERIRVAVQDNLPITVSIGVAVSAHGDSPSTLFSRADAALYLAKAAGRNCVYLHEGAGGSIVGIKTRPGDKRPAAELNHAHA
jgi:diguanylate cyclase (GGDEF)-like protein